jgi:hypothetical protein
MEVSSSFLPPTDIDTHMIYAAQQRLDGYTEAVHHAIRRKATFDRKVMRSKAGVVEFQKGQLVQVYNNKLAQTLSTERKITPLWSPPRRVTERLLNSYKLETLDGASLDGLFNARRLRGFTPREGTELAAQQKVFEETLAAQESVVVGQDEVQSAEPARIEEEEAAEEDPRNAELVEAELGRPEMEGLDMGRDEGFFYEDEGEEVQDDDDIGIGARVAARRRGRLHNGEGQME